MSTYHTRHRRVVRARGRASEHTCVDCGSAASDWSQIRGTDGESVDDYEPRCKRCHNLYDDIYLKSSRIQSGRQRPDISERMKGNTYATGHKGRNSGKGWTLIDGKRVYDK